MQGDGYGDDGEGDDNGPGDDYVTVNDDGEDDRRWRRLCR